MYMRILCKRTLWALQIRQIREVDFYTQDLQFLFLILSLLIEIRRPARRRKGHEFKPNALDFIFPRLTFRAIDKFSCPMTTTPGHGTSAFKGCP